MNGKGLMVSISEEPRSLSPSPHPPPQHMSMVPHQHHGGHQHQHQQAYSHARGMGCSNSAMNANIGAGASPSGMAHDGGHDSPYIAQEDDDSGEGEISQFGRAKKAKRKAAPRTSRACLACRRQKMRCEGAENPPCRRCISNEVDCMFERRSDYLLNPEDRAWQNGVEKRLEHLSRTIDMILAHLGNQSASAPPNTAGPSFQDMPAAAPYYESFERHAVPPNTAPVGAGDMADPNMGMISAGARVNYVVPSQAETAAIAAQAQARARRTRGHTLPNLPSASYTPDNSGFQLFSPRIGGLDNGIPNNQLAYGAPTPGPPPSSQPHHAHPHQQHHPNEVGPPTSQPLHTGGHSQYAHTPSNAYSFETYSGGPGDSNHTSGQSGSRSRGHGSFSNENNGAYNDGGMNEGDPRDQQHQLENSTLDNVGSDGTAQNVAADLVPRSLSSPNVRYAHLHSTARDDVHAAEIEAPLHVTEGTA